MINEKEYNHYLITEIMHLPIFSSVKPVVKLFVYFIPYKYNNSLEVNENPVEEQAKKRKYIENIPHFRDVQQQGFGNVALREKDVNFVYFYNRLVYFEDTYSPEPLESKKMRKAISSIMELPALYLKVKHLIPDEIKRKIINETYQNEVKHTLAKLFLYAIRGNEFSWPSENECKKILLYDIGKEFPEKIFSYNVHLGMRRDLDESIDQLAARIRRANCVQILCQCGSALFGGSEVSRAYSHQGKTFFDLVFENKGNEQVDADNITPDIDIILSGGCEKARRDTIYYKMYPTQERMSKDEIISYCIQQIYAMRDKLVENRNKNKILVRYTDIVLPYALLFVKYEDRKKDFLKLDLYSPCIQDNQNRPSTWIFRSLQKELFEHFEKVYNCIWSSEQFSQPGSEKKLL